MMDKISFIIKHHNKQVKSVVSEAKDRVTSSKHKAYITKLNKGMELIDQRQKLILLADKSSMAGKLSANT